MDDGVGDHLSAVHPDLSKAVRIGKALVLRLQHWDSYQGWATVGQAEKQDQVDEEKHGNRHLHTHRKEAADWRISSQEKIPKFLGG